VKFLDDKGRRRLLGTARARLWRTARMLRRFTAEELAEVSLAGLSNCREYLQRLRQAGIVTLAFAPRLGSPIDGPTIYQLDQDLGPLPPVIGDYGRVLDFNLSPTGIAPSIEALL
jgi:hypothetical protein